MSGYEEMGGKKKYDDHPEVDGACTKIILECHMVVFDTYSYHSVQSMGIVMGSSVNWKHLRSCL